jgi:catecholate siderophore receptor
LKVGGGATAVGRRIIYGLNSSTPSVNNVPSYVRFDAMAQYDIKNEYTIKLNIQNLMNKTIYESAYENGGFVVPGTKRAFQLTGTYKF